MSGERTSLGRKLKYDPEKTPKLVEGYAMDGLTDAQIAAKLGIVASTLYAWKNQYPEFDKAIKAGRAPLNVDLEKTAVKSALGGFIEEEKTEAILDVQNQRPTSYKKTTSKRYIPPNTTVLLFLLKNRMPEKYKEVSQHEVTGKDGERLFPSIAELMMEDNDGSEEQLEE